MAVCWVVWEGFYEGLTLNLISYHPHFSLNIPKSKWEKREGMCAKLRSSI